MKYICEGCKKKSEEERYHLTVSRGCTFYISVDICLACLKKLKQLAKELKLKLDS